MLTTVVAGALALIAVPRLNDAKPLTVLSGSMTGTYDIGDVVIVRPVDTAELRAGDVITFQPVSDNPALTTHRIEAVSYGSEGTQFITKGDANDAIDPEPIRPEQVMGQVWYSVPLVGHASVWMAGDWAQLAIHALAGVLLLYGTWLFGAGVLERARGGAPEEQVEQQPGLPALPKPPRVDWAHDMNRSYRHAFAASGVLAMVAVLIVVVGSPARAASERPRLLVGSSAGGPFLDQLPTALFTGAEPVVPGQGVGDTFWVKNASGAPARISVSLPDTEPSNELEAALAYDVKVGGAQLPTRLARSGRDACHTVAARRVIDPGAVQAVTVTAHLPRKAGPATMNQSASTDLRVTLTETPGGDIEICGDEAEDDPTQPTSAQTGGGQTGGGHSGGPAADGTVDCGQDVVITTTGTPTCVPTAVDAGVGGGHDDGFGGAGTWDTRPAAVVAGLLGGLLLLWAKRRREADEPAPDLA